MMIVFIHYSQSHHLEHMMRAIFNFFLSYSFSYGFWVERVSGIMQCFLIKMRPLIFVQQLSLILIIYVIQCSMHWVLGTQWLSISMTKSSVCVCVYYVIQNEFFFSMELHKIPNNYRHFGDLTVFSDMQKRILKLPRHITHLRKIKGILSLT